jgi:hypothetical protein
MTHKKLHFYILLGVLALILVSYSIFNTGRAATSSKDEVPAIDTNLVVRTDLAGSITSSQAVLGGYIQNRGEEENISTYFEWGKDFSKLDRKADAKTNKGDAPDYRTAKISGLSSNTAYYYRLVGKSSAGLRKGTILSFITPSSGGALSAEVSRPDIYTNSASDLSDSGAVLNAFINTDSTAETNYWFEWSIDSEIFENQTEVKAAESSGPVSAEIKDLDSNTSYYFRAVGQNKWGLTYSRIMSFRTL